MSLHFDSRRSIEIGVDALRREHHLGDALGRVLVEIQPRRAEGEIEIGDDALDFEDARNRPGEIMRNIGGADAALGADHRDDAPQRFRVRSVVEMRHVLNEVQHLERRHDIIADAARGQHAIERDVVLVADDDDLGAGVAIFRQVVEIGDQAGAVGDRLDDDEIGRRRAAEGLDGGGDAAHVDLHVRLQHPAVHRRAFDRSRRRARFRKRPGSKCAAPARFGARDRPRRRFDRR